MMNDLIKYFKNFQRYQDDADLEALHQELIKDSDLTQFENGTPIPLAKSQNCGDVKIILIKVDLAT